MAFFLIAVIVIIIVVVSVQINNINNSTPTYDVSYDLVTKEVISLLEMLQKFYKNDSDWFSSLVMIIPVDLSGNLYGYSIEGKRNAEKILIELLITEKVDDMLLRVIENRANQTGSDSFFRLSNRDGQTQYTATSTYRFNGKFKKFMPYLHSAVVKRFPELSIQFDGSRIIIDHM
ncbi:MAG: hypothetical protein OSJ43_16055 [Oscillospiraceae bacterium]|nr:hypothetical protein [Oscillospiraceae bacterium]